MMRFVPHEYMPYVKNGYVSRNVHSEDENVVILNYTPETVYSRTWNDVTMHCRGLILNEKTGEILARPFVKFWNYGESIGDGRIPRIPSGDPEITVKQDGSLGILYRLNNSIRIATRGSFTSEQSKAGQTIWDTKYSHLNDWLSNEMSHLTLLFEIIHSVTRVVVPYNFEDLVLIGVINRDTGEDWNYKKMRDIFGMCFRITERVEGSLEHMLNKTKTLNYDEEGFVLRWENGYRLKVKGEKYLEVHKIMYGLSLNHKLDRWVNERLDELIYLVPEEFRKELEDIEDELDYGLSCAIEDINYWYEEAPKHTRKNFALFIKKNCPQFSTLLFLKMDNKLEHRDVREWVVRRYKEGLKDG